MKRNAIIISAGTSSRFVPLSYEIPKGLLEVKGEILIERQIRQLNEAGIKDITIVVGYMAEKFTYLCEKYGVQLVINEDYLRYNNTSSVIRVLSRISNTYICCSDQYYKYNPFLQELRTSAYAALYADGKTNEYCLTTDVDGYIKEVKVGGENEWYMAGFAYFCEAFSREFRKIMVDAYAKEETRQMYWEDVYIKHIHALPPMRIIKFENNTLCEFDSIDELRVFDTTYIEDTRSEIVKEICRLLQCKDNELGDFKRVDKKQGHIFTFVYNNFTYLYANGNIERC